MQTRKIIVTIVAVLITIGFLWHTNRVIAPKEATWDDVLTESKRGGYRIINTDELWQKYKTGPDSVLLVDTRQEWEYRTGHIKSALNFPMEPTWLSRWRQKGALAEFLGADKNRFIVFY